MAFPYSCRCFLKVSITIHQAAATASQPHPAPNSTTDGTAPIGMHELCPWLTSVSTSAPSSQMHECSCTGLEKHACYQKMKRSLVNVYSLVPYFKMDVDFILLSTMLEIYTIYLRFESNDRDRTHVKRISHRTQQIMNRI